MNQELQDAIDTVIVSAQEVAESYREYDNWAHVPIGRVQDLEIALDAYKAVAAAELAGVTGA